MSRVQVARRAILGLTLAGVTVLAFLHQRIQGMPSIDALDPFGGLETLLKFVAGGELVKKIEPGTVVLFGAIVLLGVILSRFFCGWFCAFGALQAIFGWLGRRIFRRRFAVPRRLDSALRWAKYPFLLVILYFTWRAGDLVIRPYDPMAAYGHLSAGLGAVWAQFTVGFIVLVLVMLLSMLYERAFCKYLCPLGAVNAILSRVPLFRIRREEATCISCAKCDRACPMNIEVSKADRVDSPECIACLECVTACPTPKSTLATFLAGKKSQPVVVVALGIAIYLLAAGVGQGLGMLHFSPKSLRQQASGGSLKVEDIKGSSTYTQVSEAFGIDLDRLYREAGVDQKKVPPKSMLKDTSKLAGIEGFEADTVRVAVARIIGVDYAGEKGTASTVPEPKAPTPESKAAAPAPPATPQVVDTGDLGRKGAASISVPADFVLEGTMSVYDVASALGASPEAVLGKLKLPVDLPIDKPLKELKDQYGFSMPDLKARIKQ